MIVACSRMYDAAPSATAAWRRLFGWLAHEASVPLAVIDHPPPAPLEHLWERPDLGCTFMCGFPYSLSDDPPLVLAAPVPAGGEYADQPVYFTDLVVRSESAFYDLEDTFGGRIAWTVEHSHSGFNAVRHHLLKFRRPDRPKLYAETVGPVVSPMGAIQAVVEGRADVAPLDSYFHDLLRRHAPDVAAKVRVIGRTDPAPIPLLVSSRSIESTLIHRMQARLLAAHEDAEGRRLLEDVCLARFAMADPEDYQQIRERALEAQEAGYPAPA